ncbi:DnaJ domain-containing protein [Salibacterium sp. K-3]
MAFEPVDFYAHKRKKEVTEAEDVLSTIETEIRQYQEIIGESVLEIGKRLRKVKDEDLTHGEFTGWLEKVGIQPRKAQRMMQAADQLGDLTSEHTSALTGLSPTKLYAMLSLPSDIDRRKFIEQAHELPDQPGVTKTVADMSAREVEAVVKARKQPRQKPRETGKEGSKGQSRQQRQQPSEGDELNANNILRHRMKERIPQFTRECVHDYDLISQADTEVISEYTDQLHQAVEGSLHLLNQYEADPRKRVIFEYLCHSLSVVKDDEQLNRFVENLEDEGEESEVEQISEDMSMSDAAQRIRPDLWDSLEDGEHVQISDIKPFARLSHDDQERCLKEWWSIDANVNLEGVSDKYHFGISGDNFSHLIAIINKGVRAGFSARTEELIDQLDEFNRMSWTHEEYRRKLEEIEGELDRLIAERERAQEESKRKYQGFDDFFRQFGSKQQDNRKYYRTLGLEPDASQADIKRKYRELMKVVHPDQGGNDYLFELVKEAYDTLTEKQATAAG